jgi:hypothetical protein
MRHAATKARAALVTVLIGLSAARLFFGQDADPCRERSSRAASRSSGWASESSAGPTRTPSAREAGLRSRWCRGGCVPGPTGKVVGTDHRDRLRLSKVDGPSRGVRSGACCGAGPRRPVGARGADDDPGPSLARAQEEGEEALRSPPL